MLATVKHRCFQQKKESQFVMQAKGIGIQSGINQWTSNGLKSAKSRGLYLSFGEQAFVWKIKGLQTRCIFSLQQSFAFKNSDEKFQTKEKF